MWKLLEDVKLFDRQTDHNQQYDAHGHLAHFISLFRNPPHLVMQRERMGCEYRLREPIIDGDSS
jgi:hypothetical protein